MEKHNRVREIYIVTDMKSWYEWLRNSFHNFLASGIVCFPLSSRGMTVSFNSLTHTLLSTSNRWQPLLSQKSPFLRDAQEGRPKSTPSVPPLQGFRPMNIDLFIPFQDGPAHHKIESNWWSDLLSDMTRQSRAVPILSNSNLMIGYLSYCNINPRATHGSFIWGYSPRAIVTFNET